jgi:hypothetical protein
MIARLANVYVRFLLLVQLVFLGLSLSVLAGTLLSTNPIFAEHGKYLLDCVFVAFVPAVSLAEEKNIWKNEKSDSHGLRNACRVRAGGVFETTPT